MHLNGRLFITYSECSPKCSFSCQLLVCKLGCLTHQSLLLEALAFPFKCYSTPEGWACCYSLWKHWWSLLSCCLWCIYLSFSSSLLSSFTKCRLFWVHSWGSAFAWGCHCSSNLWPPSFWVWEYRCWRPLCFHVIIWFTYSNYLLSLCSEVRVTSDLPVPATSDSADPVTTDLASDSFPFSIF